MVRDHSPRALCLMVCVCVDGAEGHMAFRGGLSPGKPLSVQDLDDRPPVSHRLMQLWEINVEQVRELRSPQ